MDNLSKPRVALITLPIGNKIGESFITKSLELLEPLCGKLFLITGNFPAKKLPQVCAFNVSSPLGSGGNRTVWFRVLRFLLIQLKTSFKLVQISSKLDIALFHLGGELNIVPILCAKLLRKKIIIFYFGIQKSFEMRLNELSKTGRVIFPASARVLERIIFRIADRIAVETEGIAKNRVLRRYKNKVFANINLYVDTDRFKVEKDLRCRKQLVGVICSLVPKKGVSNLVDAIPLILTEMPDTEFVIGGYGPLFVDIRNRIEKDKLMKTVNLTGWLSDDDLVFQLNEMKLFVLPSFEEGLPNIILEAMACGTPVLATPVGGIPDVIKDEKTGFMLEDNSAESVARGVIRALSNPKLSSTSESACALIHDKYSYNVVVRRYEDVLTGLFKKTEKQKGPEFG